MAFVGGEVIGGLFCKGVNDTQGLSFAGVGRSDEETSAAKSGPVEYGVTVGAGVG